MDFGRARMRQAIVLEDVCIIPGRMDVMDSANVSLRNFSSAVVIHSNGRDVYHNWNVLRNSRGIRLYGSKTCYMPPIRMADCYLQGIHITAERRRAAEVVLPNKKNLLTSAGARGRKSGAEVHFVNSSAPVVQFWIFSRTTPDEKGWQELKSQSLLATIDGRDFDSAEKNVHLFLSRYDSVHHPFCISPHTSDTPGNIYEYWRKIQFHALYEKLHTCLLPDSTGEYLRTELAEVGLGLTRLATSRLFEQLSKDHMVAPDHIVVDTSAEDALDLDSSSSRFEAAYGGLNSADIFGPEQFPKAGTDGIEDLSLPLTKEVSMSGLAITDGNHSVQFAAGRSREAMLRSLMPIIETTGDIKSGIKHGLRSVMHTAREIESLDALLEEINVKLDRPKEHG
ncbi:hypothetical protein TWF694_003479 [Orbilia ellipsospora]|uniref:Uncharacterized protein n=1 Tax=Orbilia ellipsospora TaxID=2528407 RepID=A0AAV9WZN0_9PEZI